MGLNMKNRLCRTVTAAALLLVAGAVSAQTANVIDLTSSVATPTVNLTAERMLASLPDGTSAPMWGYCTTGWLDGTTAKTLPAGTRTCANAGVAPAAWAPGPTLIVKAGAAGVAATLNIQLTNALPTPTSLVILGQLGGGLGTPIRASSPTHATQTQTTWFANGTCKSDGTTACKPFTPPQQAPRVMSFGTQAAINGGTAALTWTNLRPGTYLYETGTHPSIQAPMGLYGVLVVTAEPVSTAAVPPAPASFTPGSAFPGAFPNLGTTPQLSVGNTPLINVGYDADAVALLSEIDAVQNAVVDAAAAAACPGFAAPGAVGACTGTLNEASYPPAVNYTPTYFLVNGQAFSNTNLTGNAIVMNDTASTGNVMVRFVNAGLRTHVPSIVGQSMSLIAEDGNVAPGSPKVQSEVLLPAGKTVDALITPAFTGTTYADAAFPMFDRELGTSTGNTPNGGIHGFLVLAAPGANLANALKSFTPATLAAITAKLNPSTFNIGTSLTSFSANALAGSVGVSNAAFGTISGGLCPTAFAGSLSSGPQTCLTAGGQSVTLRPDGSFTIMPKTGSPYVVADSFSFYGNGTPGMSTSVTLTGCGSACDATVTAADLTFPNTKFPNSRFWSVKNAAVLKVHAPGVLADIAPKLVAAQTSDTPPQLVDSKGRALQAVLVDVSGNPTTLPWVTVNSDGSFTAANCGSAPPPAVPTPAPVGTCSFNFIAVNQFGVASGIQSVKINFPAGSGLPTTLVDTATKDATTPRTVTDYAWVIEEDTTYVTTPGVTPPIVNGIPQASLATSFHKSHMPMVAVGCTGSLSCGDSQSINNGGPVALRPRSLPADVVLDPTKRYYISVLPGDAGNAFISGFNTDPNIDTSCLDAGTCGHSMGGANIPPLAAGLLAYPPTKVLVERNPLPTATLAVYIYEDNAPTNGQNDANENGLGGFEIIVNDVAGRSGDPVGQITYDALNMPLTNALLGTPGCPDLGNATTHGAKGTGNNLTGVVYTCPDGIDPATDAPYALAGMALIKNLMPGRFDVLAKPSAAREANGEVWYQTETLEGTPGQDAFTRAGEPNYFQEFGSPGFHTTIGFVNPANVAKQAKDYLAANKIPAANLYHVRGQITNLHMSRPTEETIYDSGSYKALSQTTCLVSINQGGANSETGLNLGFATCNPDGSFDIPNVPGSASGEQYELFVWDEWLDQIRAFKAVTVNQADVKLPNIPVFSWFTRVEASMFIDANQNGVRDPGEEGANQLTINIRFRDGSISNVLKTDSSGHATFSELFPLFNWYVTEADTTRYHLGPVNITVDAGGPVQADALDPGILNSHYKAVDPITALSNPADPTYTNRIDPDGTLYEGLQGFIGQTAKIDWARWQFGKTKVSDGAGGTTTLEALGVEENGGIAGFIAYATTRGFDDPAKYIQNLWTPGVPRVTVNLYAETANADGTTSLELVDTTTSNSWDDFVNRTGAYAGLPAMQCPGQTPAVPNGATTYDPAKNDPFVNYTLGSANQFKCYDGFHMWNQVQQAVYDGAYVFPTANYKYAGSFVDGKNLGNKLLLGSVMPGKYVIEIVPPQGYEVFKEEDKNILIGDAWIAPPASQFGSLASVFIIPDAAVLSQGANPNNPNQNNPTLNLGDAGRALAYVPCVGGTHRVPDFLTLFPNSGQVAPFAGADKPLCNRKEVVMEPHGAPGAVFALFTPTPVASHFTGLILDDAASEVNATSPDFGEKFALAYAPVSIKDITGNEIERVYSDQWGNYNGVLYSTWQVSVPNPAGYSPNMMITCMNDPGPIPDPSGKIDTATGKVRLITDPQYNPNFSNFCYTNPFMPGMTVYLDTPVLPVAAFANGYQPADSEFPAGTPAIKRVDSNAAGVFGPYLPAATGGTLTIQAVGDKIIPNPAYQGPVAALMAPTDPNYTLFNSKTITRHYGFGAFGGGGNGGGGGSRVQLVNTATNVATTLTTGNANWNDNQIVATVAPTLPAGNYHLEIRDRNGHSTVDSAIVTIGGPAPLLVTKRSGFAGSFGTIQSAIDTATPGALILVDAGSYPELVVMWKPVQLQGVGAESVIVNAAKYPTSKLQNWRPIINNLFGLDPADPTFNTLVGKPQVDALPTQTLTGGIVLLEPTVLSTEEGAGITVLAKNGPSRTPINDDPGQTTPFADCAYLTALNPPLAAYSDYPIVGGQAHLMAESNFNCARSRIDGLSVTGGDSGGGIYVNGWAHGLEIADTHVYGNAGALNGGVRIGIPFLESLPNPPANGFQYDRNVHIHHNAITRNGTVEGTPGAGTAANVTGVGGGLTLATGSDNYRVDHNWIAGNFGSADGGGVGHIGMSRNGSIDHNTVIFNQAYQQTAASHGGGIVAEGEVGANGVALGTGNLSIDANLIQGNFAETGHGGGIRLAQVNGQDVLSNPGNVSRWYSVSVTNNMIINNVAGWAGGGISMVDTLHSSIVNNTIASNDSVGIAGVILQTDGTTVTGRASPAGLAAEPTGDALRAAILGAIPQAQNPTFNLVPALTAAEQARVTAGLTAGTVIAPNTAAGAATFLGETPPPVVHTNAWYNSFRTQYIAALASFQSVPQLQANAQISSPVLFNNILWQNRSFYFSSAVAQKGAGSAVAPGLYASNTNGPNGQGSGTNTVTPQTAAGQCTAGAAYWDLGVVGDASPTPGAVALNPVDSTMTSTAGYLGANLRTTDPGLVHQYCNGARAYPDIQFEPGAGVLEPFTLQPSMTLDEAGNYVNLSFGPLSLADPVLAGGVVFGDYHISSGIDGGVGAFGGVTAPNLDFDGQPRPTGTRWDSGADQFTANNGTCLVYDPTSLTFASSINVTTAAQMVTVYNTCTGAATPVPVIGIGGGNSPTQFAQTNDCAATLSTGSSCVISVTFMPTSGTPATKTANVTAGGGNVVGLTGTVVVPTYTVTPTTTTTSRFNFGSTPIHVPVLSSLATLPAQGFLITNTSTLASGSVLVINNLPITGANANQFSVASSTCPAAPAGLTPGQSCTVVVQFLPTSVTPAPGTKNATMTITVAAGGNTPVFLTGTATAGVGVISPLPSPLAFGAVTATTTQTITVTNTSTVGGLVITGTSFPGGTSGGRFSVVPAQSSCLATPRPVVASGGTCTIAVRYTPGGAANATLRTVTLQIAGDGAPATSTVSVSATGN